MSKKFPYGYDVNVYVDKAFERMKELYPWAAREMMNKKWSYAIEKVGRRYRYVTYYSWDDGEKERREYDYSDCEDFISHVIWLNEDCIQRENPVKDTLEVDLPRGLVIRDWYMERYAFRSHEKGGYSVYLQGGNRSAGGSRTIFIPPAYFKLSWQEFLDKYVELVPPRAFGLDKDFLEQVPGLKTFLGY